MNLMDKEVIRQYDIARREIVNYLSDEPIPSVTITGYVAKTFNLYQDNVNFAYWCLVKDGEITRTPEGVKKSA